MNYYPFHIGDYSAHTAHLDPLEDIAYRRAIDAYMLAEGPLPAEPADVARRIRMRDHVEIVAAILREFFTLTDDGWRHKRCDEELIKAQSKSAKARESALASVRSRDVKNKVLRSDRMAAARQKGVHSSEEWGALVLACGSRCVKCGSDGPLERDHIEPVYQGGSDGIENIQPLCKRCNTSKGPDSTDFRPGGWRASLERTLSERSANVQRTESKRSAPKTQDPIPKTQEEERERANAGKPALSPRGERIPDGFPGADEHRWCRTERAELDPAAVGEKFRDYWLGVPGARGRKTDWPATWRNFVRSERAPQQARASPYRSASDLRDDTTGEFLHSLTGGLAGKPRAHLRTIDERSDVPSLALPRD